DDPEARLEVSDAGDGSAYTEAHAEHHPALSSLAESLGFGDLMLISAETGEIVYSTDKRIDFGTPSSPAVGFEFKRTFTVPGTYQFACSIHYRMTMRVEVSK
ncbi:MAG: plastocyanin/azurin family copper-binding protein, partial [Acidobacteriota bacterium]